MIEFSADFEVSWQSVSQSVGLVRLSPLCLSLSFVCSVLLLFIAATTTANSSLPSISGDFMISPTDTDYCHTEAAAAAAVLGNLWSSASAAAAANISITSMIDFAQMREFVCTAQLCSALCVVEVVVVVNTVDKQTLFLVSVVGSS